MSDLISRTELKAAVMKVAPEKVLPNWKHMSLGEKCIARHMETVYQGIIAEARDAEFVPKKEYEALLARFRHLLESKFISSFDAVDCMTGEYRRDIKEADKIARENNDGNAKACWQAVKIVGLMGNTVSYGFVCSHCGTFSGDNKIRECKQCKAQMDVGGVINAQDHFPGSQA